MIGQKGIPAVYGGVERHVEEISVRLAAQGHDLLVYTRPYYMEENKARLQTASLPGVHLKTLPTIKSKHLDAIVHTGICSCHVLAQHVDIVHYHAIGPSTVSFIPRLCGKKVVVTVHGLDWQRKKWNRYASLLLRLGEKTAYYFPHETITVSKTLKHYYDEHYKPKARYIPNGVTIPHIAEPHIIRQKYSLEKNSYVVFISRLVPEKGCSYLIEAFKKVITNKKLVIAGGSSHSDDYVGYLHNIAANDPRIIFTGNVFGAELAELFSNAYCFVLPSEMEGLPIVILEALSFNKCVMASDIPENMEVISPQKKDEYGYSFENKNAADLQKKLQFLLDNPDKCAVMEKKAQKYVASQYNWDTIAGQLEEVYYSLVR